MCITPHRHFKGGKVKKKNVRIKENYDLQMELQKKLGNDQSQWVCTVTIRLV